MARVAAGRDGLTAHYRTTAGTWSTGCRKGRWPPDAPDNVVTVLAGSRSADGDG